MLAFFLAVSGLLSGCALTGVHGIAGPPPLADRIQNAHRLVQQSEWVWSAQDHRHPALQVAWKKSSAPVGLLTVYIEGDGLAWQNRTTPSDDPTPVNPVGLRMALQDSGPAAYLGRACQYGRTPPMGKCTAEYWTTHRYSADVVNWNLEALDHLKALTGASSLRLVGYSGGSVIALLLAARRADVQEIVTVAGNLDIQYWTHRMRISPLTGSLNPAHEWTRLTRIQQTHWAGGLDRTVPVDVVQRYVDLFPITKRPQLKVMATFDHHCCWAENWATLHRGAASPLSDTR